MQNNTEHRLVSLCDCIRIWLVIFKIIRGGKFILTFSSENEIKFPLMMFQWPAMPDGYMKIRGNLVWLKKFHLKKMMFW